MPKGYRPETHTLKKGSTLPLQRPENMDTAYSLSDEFQLCVSIHNSPLLGTYLRAEFFRADQEPISKKERPLVFMEISYKDEESDNADPETLKPVLMTMYGDKALALYRKPLSSKGFYHVSGRIGKLKESYNFQDLSATYRSINKKAVTKRFEMGFHVPEIQQGVKNKDVPEITHFTF